MPGSEYGRDLSHKYHEYYRSDNKDQFSASVREVLQFWTQRVTCSRKGVHRAVVFTLIHNIASYSGICTVEIPVMGMIYA